MAALMRFVRLGLEDPRLARLTAPEALDDARVIRIIEASAVFRSAARVTDRIRRAGSSSVVRGLGRTMFEQWARTQPASRRVAVGTMLIAASVVYVAVTMWSAATPGWLWAIVPGIASAVGALLIASGVPRR